MTCIQSSLNQEEQETDVAEIEEDGRNHSRIQTSLDDLRKERRNGVTRAYIARYNTQTLCTQYIEVAIVNSAAATYIGLEKEEKFYGVRIGTNWRAAANLAIRSQGSGRTAHCENKKKLRYQKLLGQHVDNTHTSFCAICDGSNWTFGTCSK
jgi:hypothetical protein